MTEAEPRPERQEVPRPDRGPRLEHRAPPGRVARALLVQDARGAGGRVRGRGLRARARAARTAAA